MDVNDEFIGIFPIARMSSVWAVRCTSAVVWWVQCVMVPLPWSTSRFQMVATLLRAKTLLVSKKVVL